MSVTKNIVSLLVGIAIEQGLIGSIDDYVPDYFPHYKIKRGEKTIQKVTLKNLLTMTAPYKYKSEPWSKICVQEDWSIAALDFLGGKSSMTGEFRYSTLGIPILTGIIAAVSKMTTVDFANKYLFGPLTIAPNRGKNGRLDVIPYGFNESIVSIFRNFPKREYICCDKVIIMV